MRHGISNNVQAHVRLGRRVTGNEGESAKLTGHPRLLRPLSRIGTDEGLKCRVGDGLAVSATADAPEAPGLVETLLFSSRTEEPPVAQLAQNSRPLHLGLKSLQKLFAVFSVTERYVCQFSIFSIFSKTNQAGHSARRTDYTTSRTANCNDITDEVTKSMTAALPHAESRVSAPSLLR